MEIPFRQKGLFKSLESSLAGVKKGRKFAWQYLLNNQFVAIAVKILQLQGYIFLQVFTHFS